MTEDNCSNGGDEDADEDNEDEMSSVSSSILTWLLLLLLIKFEYCVELNMDGDEDDDDKVKDELEFNSSVGSLNSIKSKNLSDRLICLYLKYNPFKLKQSKLFLCLFK